MFSHNGLHGAGDASIKRKLKVTQQDQHRHELDTTEYTETNPPGGSMKTGGGKSNMYICPDVWCKQLAGR